MTEKSNVSLTEIQREFVELCKKLKIQPRVSNLKFNDADYFKTTEFICHDLTVCLIIGNKTPSDIVQAIFDAGTLSGYHMKDKDVKEKTISFLTAIGFPIK